MKVAIRLEEYVPLGDFIKSSYIRDFEAIKAHYPKMNEAYRDEFSAKLTFVGNLESNLVLKDARKNLTKELYTEASVLNRKLTFLNSYFRELGLDSASVTTLKSDLNSSNIEGALLRIKGLKQYVEAHSSALIDEGMEPDFADQMEEHWTNLSKNNALQNAKMNEMKALTQKNMADYEALYRYISKIARAGKLVFKDTVTEDEYVMGKLLKRMRANKMAALEKEGGANEVLS